MAKNETTQEARTPILIAWNVTGTDDKAFWTRIGAAWPHKDAKGMTLQLDMLPINGRIVLREPSELQNAATAGAM